MTSLSSATQVNLVNNRDDPLIDSGQRLPHLLQAESPSSSILLIDSDDRIKGTCNEYTVALRSRLTRTRYLRLVKATVPKLNNITEMNNQFRIVHALGTTGTITLPTGLYSTGDLANRLTASINQAYLSAGIADVVAVTYSLISRSFTITSTLAQAFFIDEASTFIIRGRHLAPFESQPITDVPSKTSVLSGVSGMLYTRYLTISSDALTQNAFSSSILSASNQPSNLIGIIDLASIYTSEDFASTRHSPLYDVVPVDGAHVQLLSGQFSMNSLIDIRVTDGYSISLDYALGPSPLNQIGLVLMFEVDF